VTIKLLEDFQKCVIVKENSIECKLGLWSVYGGTEKQQLDEALHYFSQYKEDGEYYSILGGKSPVEMFMESPSNPL